MGWNHEHRSASLLRSPWAKELSTLLFGICIKVKVAILGDKIINTLVLLIYSNYFNDVGFDVILLFMNFSNCIF